MLPRSGAAARSGSASASGVFGGAAVAALAPFLPLLMVNRRQARPVAKTPHQVGDRLPHLAQRHGEQDNQADNQQRHQDDRRRQRAKPGDEQPADGIAEIAAAFPLGRQRPRLVAAGQQVNERQPEHKQDQRPHQLFPVGGRVSPQPQADQPHPQRRKRRPALATRPSPPPAPAAPSTVPSYSRARRGSRLNSVTSPTISSTNADDLRAQDGAQDGAQVQPAASRFLGPASLCHRFLLYP